MAGPPAAAKQFNKVAVRLAGHRLLPVWAVLHHTGRTSGAAYATPIAVLPTDTTFVIGLPWGRRTDWVRNVRAAGGCTIRWKGHDFTCTEPTFVDRSVALGAAGGFSRRYLEKHDMPGGYLQLTRTPAPEHSAMQSGW
jgi:deazaflavin-dependent oxidoreductase (nitroreductase family)